MTDRITSEQLSRRSLGVVAAAGIALPVLVACADESGTATDGSTGGATNAGASTPSSPSGTASPSGDGSRSAQGSRGGLAATSDIEVGGGAVFKERNVVITQPAKGEFRGFSATCTHQGCQVGEVSDGTINCPCHNSSFSIEDGSVQGGPAPQPLPEVQITVKDGEITLT